MSVPFETSGQYFDSEAERQEEINRIDDLKAQALQDRNFDFFAQDRMPTPKRTIGEYVMSQGHNVPLIQTDEEWKEAFDNETAMARSELLQDYAGLFGLLSSRVLHHRLFDSPYSGVSYEWSEKQEALIRDGLRSGELPISSYMSQFVWPAQQRSLAVEAVRFGDPNLGIDFPEASHWRFIPGTNIHIFRDPTIAERYWFRTSYHGGYVHGWEAEPHHYDYPLSADADSPVTTPVGELVEFYESIRALPLFDTDETPVMEIQLDDSAAFHFLQYHKTGHRLDPVEPFPITTSETGTRADDVRGATGPEGEDFRLYIAPRRITKRMKGQGFYFGMIHPDSFSFGYQMMSRVSRFIVHETYISMKNNHWNSAPVYMPEVSIGIRNSEQVEAKKAARQLVSVANPRYGDAPLNADVFVEAHLTANGHEAVLESDWQAKFEEW